jgi:glycosyltransferase involved in cell wall biosynthesis
MLSVIIPSRQPEFLQKTIDDLLQKAEGEIEVIVVLDGYWPTPMITGDNRVSIIHQGEVHDNFGMRAAINAGMALARGEYVMKVDEHVLMDQGYDVKLAADCEDDWIVVPRRYRLDAEKWEVIDDGRPPIDYMYIAYPYSRPFDRRCGLYGGGIDKQRHQDRADKLIDDTMSWQGSCWFMKKAYFEKLFPDGLNDELYGPFNHEAQELGFTCQLSGGRLVVNKKTFYAHLHKGKGGKGYGFSKEQYRKHETYKEKARRYAMNYWLTTEDYEHNFGWLVDQFNPPGWPANWPEQIKEDAKSDWSRDPSKQPSEWINLEELKI